MVTSFSGKSAVFPRSMEPPRVPGQLRVLEAVASPCYLMDFSRGRQDFIWANKAALELWGTGSLDDFQALSTAARAGHEMAKAAEWHVRVQKERKEQGPVRVCLETPCGPAFVEMCIRPFEMTLPNEAQPRVFALCSKAYNHAQQSTAHMMHMIEHLGFLAMIFSMDGSHVMSSAAAQEFYSPEKGLGAKFGLAELLTLFVWESNDDIEEFLAKLLTMSESICVEKRRKVEHGAAEMSEEKECWSELKFSIIEDCGRRVGIFLSEMDITELKKAQRDLIRLNQHQDELVAQFTHDLRTPLHGITGLTEAILTRRDLHKDIEKPLKIIKSQANRLSALVSDIVDAAANRRQSLLIRHEVVQLGDVCQAALDTVSPLVNRNVKLLKDIQPDLPPVEGDSSRLLQVLVNLLANSVRFTSKGHIRVSATVKEESIVLAVSDTGVGIPEGSIRSIFGVFERGDDRTTRKFGGSGLGLALVKTLIEAHNGSIAVESKTSADNHGTVFRAILPIRQPEPVSNQQTSRTSSDGASDQGSDLELREAAKGEGLQASPSPQHGFNPQEVPPAVTSVMTGNVKRVPEDLEILNELKVPCWFVDFGENPRILWANQAACFHWGRSLEALTSMDLLKDRSPVRKELEDDIHQRIQVRRETQTVRKTMFLTGNPVTFDLELRPVPLSIPGQGELTAILNIGHPLSLDDQFQADATRAHEMLRYTSSLVMLFSVTGKLLCNNVSARSFYFKESAEAARLSTPSETEDRAEGLTLHDILASCVWNNEEERDRMHDKVQELTVGMEPIVFEAKKKLAPLEDPADKSTPRERWHHLAFVPTFDPVSGQAAILVNESDVTDLRLMQQSKIELLVSRRTQNEFLSALSHELNTPLNGIISMSELIMEQAQSADLQLQCSTILTSGKQLLSLIKDMIDVATIQKDAIEINHEKTNLAEVGAAVCRKVAPIVSSRVQLTFDIDPSLPPIEGDFARLEQIIYKLAHNAAKFTQDGWIKISASMMDDDLCEIMVQDTGKGIASDVLPDIFSAFFQGDSGIARKFGGTGLGLALVKYLVEAHNGHVTVTSKDSGSQRGSRFSIVLPVVQPKSTVVERLSSGPAGNPITEREGQMAPAIKCANCDAMRTELQQLKKDVVKLKNSTASSPASSTLAPTVAEKPSPMTSPLSVGGMRSTQRVPSMVEEGDEAALSRGASSHGGTPASKAEKGASCHSMLFAGETEIMSVDDNLVNQLVIETVLKPLKFKVTQCMDGREALDLIRSRGYLPDLMLLDAMMPEIDGYEVCRQLRAQYQTSLLPIIMVSARNNEESLIAGLQAGANDYVTKPFSKHELVARVETQLKLKGLWKMEVDSQLSHELLGKMLPSHIISRLKEGVLDSGAPIVDAHDKVTLLFSDIVGYTSLASKIVITELIQILNQMFSGFDAACDRHGVYKVETIGDAYMVAAGHDGKGDQAERMIEMALDMLRVVRQIPYPGTTDGSHIQIRIGIHTGPVHAGVIGQKMPRYCFFGDTVNTASRMESNGYAMAIAVSESTKKELQHKYTFVTTGEREIKGKGKMHTFFLQSQETQWQAAVKHFTNAISQQQIPKDGLMSPMLRHHHRRWLGRVPSFNAAARPNVDLLQLEELLDSNNACEGAHRRAELSSGSPSPSHRDKPLASALAPGSDQRMDPPPTLRRLSSGSTDDGLRSRRRSSVHLLEMLPEPPEAELTLCRQRCEQLEGELAEATRQLAEARAAAVELKVALAREKERAECAEEAEALRAGEQEDAVELLQKQVEVGNKKVARLEACVSRLQQRQALSVESSLEADRELHLSRIRLSSASPAATASVASSLGGTPRAPPGQSIASRIGLSAAEDLENFGEGNTGVSSLAAAPEKRGPTSPAVVRRPSREVVRVSDIKVLPSMSSQ